jgi:dipeptidyl aminopeptidase/acylaminoacyl peptidase
LLAAQGFAVIYPSTPLGPGADNDLPAILAEQTIAAIDALATRGIVDRDRIGVMGQSFGGFSTAAILSRRSDRFKAGVAMAGAYDWMFAYGMKGVDATLTDDGRSQRVDMEIIETGQIRLGKPFWKDPQPYIRNSPIFQVERIDAPLLLLQGDLDSSLTSLPDADRMYNALVRAGKKPALVRYWGEGHVAESQSAIRDQWARIKAWFNHYLQPDGARQAAASSRAGAD